MRLFYIEELEHYKTYLVELEKGKATIEKYLRDIRTFHAWLGENLEVTKERVIAYKNYLKENYKVTSTNSMLVALNRYFQYLGWTECSVKGLRSQQQMFSPEPYFSAVMAVWGEEPTVFPEEPEIIETEA